MALYRNIGGVETAKDAFVDVTSGFDPVPLFPVRPTVDAIEPINDIEPPYPADNIGREFDMLTPVPDEVPLPRPKEVVNTAIIETPEAGDLPTAEKKTNIMAAAAALGVVYAAAATRSPLLLIGSLALLAYRLEK